MTLFAVQRVLLERVFACSGLLVVAMVTRANFLRLSFPPLTAHPFIQHRQTCHPPHKLSLFASHPQTLALCLSSSFRFSRSDTASASPRKLAGDSSFLDRPFSAFSSPATTPVRSKRNSSSTKPNAVDTATAIDTDSLLIAQAPERLPIGGFDADAEGP